MKKLILLIISITFLCSCASGGYQAAIEHYYAVEKERLTLLQKLVDQRIKSQNEDLFSIDLNKDGSVDKIKVGKGYLPIDPAITAALSRQTDPPKNPSNVFWENMWGFLKTTAPYAIGAWTVTELANIISDNAGNHSTNMTENYDIDGTGNTTNIGSGSATGSFTYSPTETITTVPQGE